MSKTRRVKVWDLFVRCFHWALVASFAISYLSTVGSQWVHEVAGYVALGLVALRVVWGFVGTKHARFANFVPGPRRLVTYLAAMLHRREPRHLGHNPAAAMMILFLLAMVCAIGISGWMLTLDAFWGSEAVEDLHVLFVDVTLLAIAVHACAAVYESWNHRENLVWSMVVGTKRAESPVQDAALPADQGDRSAQAPDSPPQRPRGLSPHVHSTRHQ